MVLEAQWNHYLGLGHHSGDPRGDPRGDFTHLVGLAYHNSHPRGDLWGDPRGGISDSYDRNGYGR